MTDDELYDYFDIFGYIPNSIRKKRNNVHYDTSGDDRDTKTLESINERA